MGEPWDVSCASHVLTGCPPEPLPECSKLDVLFVIDDTGSMGPAIASLQSLIAQLVTVVTSVATSRRFGLITFKDAVSVDLTMSDNNEAAFTTAINALTASGGGLIAENSDGALDTAVNDGAGVWRADAAKRIILITDAPPGGSDDSYSAADEANLIAQAAAGLAANILTSCVVVPGAWTPQSQVDQIYSDCAAAGGGIVTRSVATGAAQAIMAILDDQCEDEDQYEQSTHLHCCKQAACTLCLELDCYGETVLGSADWSDAEGAYVGTINGVEVRAYWAIKTECYFFIEVDGLQVAAIIKCPEYDEDSTTCRAPEAVIDDVPAGDCTGTLTVRTYEPIKLQRQKPDDDCWTKFCGGDDGPDCTCEEMCVTVFFSGTEVAAGIWENGSYQDCEIGITDPQWFGTSTGSEEWTGRIYLEEDEYGNCVLNGEISDGTTTYTLDDVIVDGTQTTTGSWTLNSYYTVTAKCQICETCGAGPFCCECRFDNGSVITGDLVSGGTPGCHIDPIVSDPAGNGAWDGSDVAEAERKWTAGDCIHSWIVTFTNAPAPGCSDPDNTRRLVVVQRSEDAEAHPSVDAGIVDNCEWYLVVYDSDDNFVSLNYEYTQCCENLELGPASSFLKYLTFANVDFGGSVVYDVDFRNADTITSQGEEC